MINVPPNKIQRKSCMAPAQTTLSWVLVTFRKGRWVQAPKELTLSVLRRKRNVSRGFSTRVPNTPTKGAERTAADLWAAPSAAGPLWVTANAQKISFGRPGACILAPWGTILAPWGHLGGPWEQQDGHRGVQNQMTESIPRVIGVAVGKR